MTIATGRYDRTAALRDGRVQLEGLDVTWLPLNVEQIFWRMMRHLEFDAAEMSFSGYVVRRARGEHDLTALPVFLSRQFRHNAIYINTNAGIREPGDLKGRRIGLPEYQMTAAVWARGLLEDDYGVRAQDIEWLQGGLEEAGRRPWQSVEPEGISLQFVPEDRTLARMLADGEIDALISPRMPSTFVSGTDPVARLFADPWAVERDYFARTGIFPIMHTFVVKTEILDANPWIAQTLTRAFMEAKRFADIDLRDTTALPISLPFLVQHVEETAELMGDDFWPYGVEPNRGTLEAFLGYAERQGLVDRAPRIEELFPASTLTVSRI
jgi:4,5-dihydroxyphthalate decarboxylase